MADERKKELEGGPGPVRQVGPDGAASPEPGDTADRDQPSALGGDVATRSRTKENEQEKK